MALVRLVKTKKQCEECEGQEGPGGSNLRERIWETQLADKREIWLNTNIDDAVIETVVVQIQNINAHDDLLDGMKGFVREPIKLFINSNGGEIYSALSVCSAIEASTTPVHTIACGKAISAGFLILICGHKRFAQKYATIMHHVGSGGVVGIITDIIEEAEALEKLNEQIHQMILFHTSITEEQLDEVFYRKNNWYMNVDEALELGVIDGVHGYSLEREVMPDVEDEKEYAQEAECEWADPCHPCTHLEILDCADCNHN